jgi:hypothetical protein
MKKKTYEKPKLVRRELLVHIAAQVQANGVGLLSQQPD